MVKAVSVLDNKKIDLSSYTIKELRELAYWQPSTGIGLIDYDAEIRKRFTKNYERPEIN